MRTRWIARYHVLAFLLVWVTLLFTAEILHGAIHNEAQTSSPIKECPICRLHATNGAIPDPAIVLKPVVQLVWLDYLPNYVVPLVRDERPAGFYRLTRAPPSLGVVSV